jgi:hypothetical protein
MLIWVMTINLQPGKPLLTPFQRVHRLAKHGIFGLQRPVLDLSPDPSFKIRREMIGHRIPPSQTLHHLSRIP